jgi:hypothetical protein
LGNPEVELFVRLGVERRWQLRKEADRPEGDERRGEDIGLRCKRRDGGLGWARFRNFVLPGLVDVGEVKADCRRFVHPRYALAFGEVCEKNVMDLECILLIKSFCGG